MKKNQNIKIRPAYKALALTALLSLVGCSKNQGHTNVILNISNTEDQAWVLMRDVETNTERLYKYSVNLHKLDSLPYYFDLLENGDTVVITPRVVYKDSYNDKKVLENDIFKLSYDENLIRQRFSGKQFAIDVEKMNIAMQHNQNVKSK